MRTLSSQLWVVLIILCVSRPTAAQTARDAGTDRNSALERGRYLVDDVARCGQCHTPRDNNGNEDRAHPLAGAPLWLNPAIPETNWPLKVPRIGGAISASDDELVRLLTTGVWKDGNRLRQPMPQFRFTAEDARVVVTYLRSVRTSPD